jgi:hypothetical protein
MWIDDSSITKQALRLKIRQYDVRDKSNKRQNPWKSFFPGVLRVIVQKTCNFSISVGDY